MKKQFHISLKISFWTILLWLVLILLNAWKIVLFCYGLMFVHEMAHVIIAFVLKCDVDKITVYPFGLCAQIHHIHHLNLYQRILLYGAGPFVHLLMYPFLIFLEEHHVISAVMSEYLSAMNFRYFVFNMLPIYPLDGYQLLYSLCCLFFPYRTALYVSQMFSFSVLIFCCAVKPQESFVYFICMGLLLLMNVMKCLHLRNEINHFYLLRMMNNKQRTHKVHEHEDLYVYCTNWIILKHRILSENQLIKRILKLEGK